MDWKYYEPKFEYEEILDPMNTGWIGHVFFAYDLVRNTKPQKIVELGTHFGHSFFAFCQAVKDKGLETELTAVDTWRGDEHSGFYGEPVYNGVKKIRDDFYKNLNIQLLRKTFDEAVSDFGDNSIDILHIDGLHTYEAVKHDFEAWLGKVKKDGIILLHDTAVTKDDFGVYKLWNEIKKRHKTLEFQHSHGLGVLFRNSGKLKKIFDFEEIWQKYYETLTDNKLLKYEINKFNQTIKDNYEEISHLQETIEEKELKLNDLNLSLDTINRKVTSLNELIQRKDAEIKHRNSEIFSKNKEIQHKDAEIQHKDAEIQHKDAEIALMKSSKFWILRNRYIKLKQFRPKHFIQLASKALEIISAGKFQKFSWAARKYVIYGWDYFKKRSQPEKPKTDYEKWMEKNEKWDGIEIKKEIEKFKYKPKISIITPVYNVDPKWLNKCIESVRNQFYENWELCLHDDASTKKETIEYLKKWEKKGDKRIKISFGEKNQHISGASNECLKMATGEFVALLDNDDELSPDALFENMKLLNKYPKADFIYSDEDKIDEGGDRVEPFFKPDWSPDLFLSQMYTCHLGVYRKAIIDEIGGFRKGYEGSQDYDLVLRFIEKTDREKILHIPKILYHWRKISGSMAAKETAKDYTAVAAKKALKDYLKRNKIEGEILDGKFPGTYRVKRKILGNPKVSIIIPFKDQADVLKVCVDSVLDKTRHKNFEIILIDNQSKERKTFEYLESLKNNPLFRQLSFDKPFNFSAINNYAVGEAKGEYILFLNNDIEVISDGWLSAMLEHAQRKEIGAVGAKLLYPNNTIQHAGVVMGLGVAGHAFKHLPSKLPGYFFQPHLIRNYCCMTAACLMLKKILFEEIGGFDEKNLSVAFNDVDLCLRLIEKGYYNVYTPYAELYHHESLSRGDDNEKNLKLKNPEKYKRVKRENEYMRAKWEKYLERDPFYSPNLTRKSEDFGLRLE